MIPRRSLSLPIILGITMILILVVLTAGWISLSVLGMLEAGRFAGVYWVLLTVGTMFIAMLLVGVILYLVLSIKAINLNRQQSNFIDSVTHELKSPIASMKLYLQTLRRRQVDEAERVGFYRYMLDDLERLDQLINQLLEAGRVESGRSIGEVEAVDVEEVLRECAAAVCKHHQVGPEVIHFCLEPCTVWARRADLVMIFRNVLDNAVKYTREFPEVVVESRCPGGGRAFFRITDNGPGIPPRMRRKVFGRFVRLGWELEREKPGTGLGLHIVQTLVRQLRGRVRILGRPSGRGTILELELPENRPES